MYKVVLKGPHFSDSLQNENIPYDTQKGKCKSMYRCI